MKKTTSGLLRLAMLAVVMVVAGLVSVASAQPKITRYYPAEGAELRPNTSAYVYFSSKVVYAKARVVQNGNVLGTCTYNATSMGNSAMMNPALEENAVIGQIPPGNFTLEFYEVSYLFNNVEEIYSDVNNLLGSVTYLRGGELGKVVGESGFSNSTILSYYAEDDNDGIKTFTFNKPIAADGIHAYYEYGAGEAYFETPLPHSLSADGLTLTIDVRGDCYNVDRLAPGYQFLDDDKNPTDPPTSINLIVNGLSCADGAGFVYTTVSPDGRYTHDVNGKIFQNYTFRDLTFPNPVIEKADFYAASDHSSRFINISADTDMMDLYVSNSEYITTCDIKFAWPEGEVTVPASAITVRGGVYTVALPQAVIAAGSEKMLVSLENVVFNAFDGSTHVIRPLDLSKLALEVLSLADLLLVEPGTDVVLSVASGLKVTLSNEAGYTFIEDENTGIQVVTEDYSKVLDEGALLIGKVAGKYIGDGIFMINIANSEFTTAGSDIYTGAMVEDIADILDGTYNNRLVTIVASDDMPIEVDPDNNIAIIAGSMIVITDFIDGYTLPEDIENVTGVVFNDPSLGAHYLLLRSDDDVNKELGLVPTVKTISKMLSMAPGTEVILKVSGAKITYSNEERMMCLLEDETAALAVASIDYDRLPATAGHALTGSIYGIYFGQNVFLFDPEQSSFTIADADVSHGARIRPETASDPKNMYRLVTFENTPETPFTIEPYQITIGTSVAAVDYFEELGEDYEFPSNVKAFTGIIMPGIQSFDLIDDPTESPALVSPRGVFDIELAENNGDVDGDGEVSIADVVITCNVILENGYNAVADLDGDGTLSVADIVLLINIILNQE